jgi:hypothetical protein
MIGIENDMNELILTEILTRVGITLQWIILIILITDS